MKIERLINEGIATFTAVFVGVSVAKLLYQENNLSGSAIVATAFFLALIIGLLYYLYGSSTTVHINPLISLAYFMNEEISFIELLVLWSVQFFAALIAVLIILAVIGPINDSYCSISSFGSVVIEIIITFLFVLFFLILVSRKGFSATSCLIIGFLLFASILFLRPLNDSLLNPFITLTDNLFQKSLSSEVWLTMLGGIFGTLLAVGAFQYFFTKRRKSIKNNRRNNSLDEEMALRDDIQEEEIII
jgi:aquaporin Z